MKAAASAAAFVLFEQHAEAPARVVQMTCKKAPLQRSTPTGPLRAPDTPAMSEKYTANIRFYR